MAASSGDHTASGGGVGCASGEESACSTPFVSAPSSPDRDPSFSAGCFYSAPSSPARDPSFSAAGCFYSAPSSPARDPSFSAAGCFYSAPASPARGGPGTADEYDGCELGFDFDFSSRCPSPAAAAMSSADELFHNGQIRPMRLTSFLLRPQALPPLDGDVPPPPQPPPHERGRLRRSPPVHRRYRSLSPFRARWLSPSSSPAPAAKSVEPAAAGEAEAAPSASRSSSSSSTASSASSSSSSRSYYRRWGFLKDILHRSKSNGGERPPLPSNPSPPPPAAAPKRNPSPSSPAAASRGRGRARRSAHALLYEARRAEAEEMRRRTFLPYRQGGLLLGCLGLGSRGFGAMHGRGRQGQTVTRAVANPTSMNPFSALPT